MLVNGSTGEILNAAKGNIIDVATVDVAENISKAFNIKVYPNPSNGITNLNVDVKQAGNISISVVNILGKTVYKNKINNTSARNYVRTIDLSNEASGIYFAKVSVNDQQQVIRINLNK
jgi:hypothetical protein